MQTDERDDQYFGLADILRIVRRRWRWVAGGAIGLTALALLMSIREDSKYTAEARILLRTVAENDTVLYDPNAEVPFFADRQLKNEIQVIESVDVHQRVVDAYTGGGSVPDVTASALETGSDAVVLSVTATEANAAADLVNLYAQEYIAFSQAYQINALAEANSQLETRIAAVDDRRDAVAAPLIEVNAQLAADPGNPALVELQATLQAGIASELEALDAQRTFFVRTQENLALSRSLAQQSLAQVLAPATPPSSPVSPQPLRNGIIALMAGLGLGFALALAREFLDQSIRSAEDLERVLKGRYSILGAIPEGPGPQDALVQGTGGHFAVAESFRALRTSVRFAELDRPMKVIQVTSPSAAEGKTTIASNLARALTQAGHRVTVACCDLRRPSIHELFGAPVSPGLVDVVLGESALAQAITQVDQLTFVLPAGTTPPNPSELLGSGRAERVMAALAEEMEYVVVDTTPVLPVTDAVVVSRFADATLVIVRAGSTTRTQLLHALSALEQASAPIIGVVLNFAPPSDRTAYGYGYGYDYMATPANGRTGRGSSKPAPNQTQ